MRELVTKILYGLSLVFSLITAILVVQIAVTWPADMSKEWTGVLRSIFWALVVTIAAGISYTMADHREVHDLSQRQPGPDASPQDTSGARPLHGPWH